MWRHIAQSIRGSSHEAEGSPCQDGNAVRLLGSGAESALVACVADGAGSAKHSDVGSAIACTSITANAALFFEQHSSFADLTLAEVHRWCDEAIALIETEAESHESKPREFASTLCVALVGADHSVFFQIGDGAIVVKDANLYGVVFWPQSGEYANTTNFLTSPTYRDYLEFLSLPRTFDNLALLTDGIERIALVFESQTAHPPFFSPLFQTLQQSEDFARLSEDLGKFLNSPSVCSRSDDDKTLILAARGSDFAVAD